MPEWIEDKHLLHFRLDQADISVFYVECPFEGKNALCNRNRDRCVIDMFVSVYGTEVNIGSTFIYGPVEIAWTPILGRCDIDDEMEQVWIVPVDDKNYIASKILGDQEELEPAEGSSE